MTVYGYARVSTKNQSLASQRIALKEAGATVIIEEKRSGTLTRRPGLDPLLAQVTDGDVIIVTRLDRLGRSLQHLLSTIQDLAARGVTTRSLHESIDTSTANGKLLLGIFALLAEFERDLIVERTKAGMAAARAAGRHPGRPRKIGPKELQTVQAMREEGHSYQSIATRLGVCKYTVMSSLKRAQEAA